jgi:hypothetical protein
MFLDDRFLDTCEHVITFEAGFGKRSLDGAYSAEIELIVSFLHGELL